MTHHARMGKRTTPSEWVGGVSIWMLAVLVAEARGFVRRGAATCLWPLCARAASRCVDGTVSQYKYLAFEPALGSAKAQP
jgi:hypothetical protein